MENIPYQAQRQEFTVLNQDELGKISDDDLFRRYKTVKNLVRSKKFSRDKMRNLEIELCYLHREHEIRENRKAAHQVWLAERRNQRRV